MKARPCLLTYRESSVDTCLELMHTVFYRTHFDFSVRGVGSLVRVRGIQCERITLQAGLNFISKSQ
jgi:hypothetical protein